MINIEKRFEPKFGTEEKEVKEKKYSEKELFELIDDLKKPELIEKSIDKLIEDIKKSPEIKEILEKPVFKVEKGDLLYSFENGDRILFRRDAQEKIKKIEEFSFTENEGWKGEFHGFGIGKERGDNFLVEKVILPKNEEVETGLTWEWETSKKYEKRVKEEADKENLKVVCHFHTHKSGDLRRSGGDERQWERMGYKFNMRLASILVPEEKKELFFFGEKNEAIEEREEEVGEGEREKIKNIFTFPREPRRDMKGKISQKEEIEKELKPKEIIKDRIIFCLNEKKEEIESIEKRISRFKKNIPLQKEFLAIKQRIKKEKRKPTREEVKKYSTFRDYIEKEFGDKRIELRGREKFEEFLTHLDLEKEIQFLEKEKKLKEEEIDKIEISKEKFLKIFKE